MMRETYLEYSESCKISLEDEINIKQDDNQQLAQISDSYEEIQTKRTSICDNFISAFEAIFLDILKERCKIYIDEIPDLKVKINLEALN